MTPRGTLDLADLRDFPCECPVCSKRTPDEVRSLPPLEREGLIATHNLHVIYAEVRRVRQAVEDGRLWELLEERARAHPSLAKLMSFVAKHADKLEEGTPLVKPRGLFVVEYTSVFRPEIRSYNRRLVEEFEPDTRLLVLLPAPRTKPYVESKAYAELRGKLREAHVVFYSPIFGPVPEELARVYPLSQYEGEPPLLPPVLAACGERVSSFVEAKGYKKILLVRAGPLGEAVERRLARLPVELAVIDADWEREVERIVEAATSFFKSP